MLCPRGTVLQFHTTLPSAYTEIQFAFFGQLDPRGKTGTKKFEMSFLIQRGYINSWVELQLLFNLASLLDQGNQVVNQHISNAATQ